MVDECIAERLKAMGVVLPSCPAPLGSYVPAVRDGGLIHTSGMLPLEDGKLTLTGPIGPGGHGVEAGANAARQCAINAVAAIAAELGGVDQLDRVQRVVQVCGHILSVDGFGEQPTVLNGASDWLGELFGEAGRHSRLALGAFALPKNASVEVAVVVRIAES
jgi:enamine deaminase RidA (YjgF/YER057c/UK114 family)